MGLGQGAARRISRGAKRRGGSERRGRGPGSQPRKVGGRRRGENDGTREQGTGLSSSGGALARGNKGGRPGVALPGGSLT